MRRAGNKSQLERAEDQGWCGPLITRLDPPFRSVIGGGGPAGPLCPVGSAPTLLSRPHLNLAAMGGKMTWVGVSTKMGRTQGRPPALASWEDAWEPCETPVGVWVTWCRRAESSPNRGKPALFPRPTLRRGWGGEKASGQSVLGFSFYSYWQIHLTDGCWPCWGF